MATNDFKVDINDYLGNDHRAFKSKLLALSFSKPSAYFELQDAVRASVKNDFVRSIYKTMYNMLTEGTNADGDVPASFNIILNGTNMQTTGFKPKVPKQLCSKIATEIAEAFDGEVDKLVEEYLIPVDNLKLASKQLKKEEVGGRIGEA